MTKSAFTNRLRQIMKEEGYSQKELAEMTGFNIQTVRQYCAPHGRVPKGKNLTILLNALGMKKEDFENYCNVVDIPTEMLFQELMTRCEYFIDGNHITFLGKNKAVET